MINGPDHREHRRSASDRADPESPGQQESSWPVSRKPRAFGQPNWIEFSNDIELDSDRA